MQVLGQLFVVLVVLLVLVGLPVGIIFAITQGRLQSKHDSPARSAMGNALQELDRLIARPSVEHKVEAEEQIKAVDEEGSD